VRRDADESAGAQHRARDRDRHVVLPEVDAIGVDGRRDVGPVVHDEERAGGARRRADRESRVVERARRRTLEPQLEQPRATGEIRVGECLRLSRPVSSGSTIA
jgi:hypothetical protein